MLFAKGINLSAAKANILVLEPMLEYFDLIGDYLSPR